MSSSTESSSTEDVPAVSAPPALRSPDSAPGDVGGSAASTEIAAPSRSETPHPEIAAAATWWADQMRIRVRSGFPTEHAISRFQEALMSILLRKCRRGQLWQAARYSPLARHELRLFHTGEQASPELQAALQAAGIDYAARLFPAGTCMWLCPGEVRITSGYRLA